MTDVHDVPARSRYETVVDGETAFAAYEVEGDVRVFTHTVVPPVIGGRGVGTDLVAGALADVRRRGLRIVPRCPFVAAYIERHPDEEDLLA
jgi:hypothetical protein